MYYFMLSLIILGIITFGFIMGYVIRLIVDYIGDRVIEEVIEAEDAKIKIMI